jgi:hypothetical protein
MAERSGESVLHTGGCLCGAVRYEVTAAPYRVGICHCLDCRKHHGAVFRAFAILPESGFRATGETHAYEDTNGTLRHFCPKCGSPLFQTKPGLDETEIFLGSLDEPDRFKPTYELWMGRRESWLPEIDVPRHYAFNREGKGRTEL